ncbi:MAG: DUF423 domain-containing protein [Opitutaceae bacterium]
MKTGLFYAGIAGLTGVMLGAFGAHALKEILTTRDSLGIWETAVFYQLTHAVAALGVNLFAQTHPSGNRKWMSRASTYWLIGIGLFSGSLYLLALGGPRWIGPVTPLGGLFLMSGWVCLLVEACHTKPASQTLTHHDR